MDLYEVTRQFYTYVLSQLDRKQATIWLNYKIWDPSFQMIVDALSFDGAIVYEGGFHKADAWIHLEPLRFYIRENEVDPGAFASICKYRHTGNAIIIKDESV